jgi:hypothetical protein
MNLRELLNRKITMRFYERNLIVIVTLLFTLLLLNIWPRFLNDALEFPLYAYIILIVLVSIPFFRRKSIKQNPY